MTDKLFEAAKHALEKEYETCPKCGSELAVKRGKAGPFIGCESYPSCDYTRPVVEHEKVEDKVLPGSECPECGHELAVKQGRYGMFIGCTNFPDCNHIEHDEAETTAEVSCPSCKKGNLVAKTTRYGKTFYPCDNYPKCKFAVNHEPVAGECEKCGFSLLLKRSMASGEKLQCADKKCGHFQSAQ
ncbi:topoisomerase DNA-binding C4 zinc finger domain-containing protein [Thalassotalea euphylliae]|uniref:DNA topoisomerase family protein n=1 Tax=Thalassotalea euphylliae TaxID=1655234 RepID=UPI003627B13C